ncbi:ras family small GTPase [Naegleria gruberi]|uniref:small monomeric GTPase n=1 Tax=Naegleria gruberi TaxID=5762 RepID=D2VL04_NAEGR|nr:ras family small GTPase [Naegleria gruberi]EFC42538.1 ras family small GTPase [Naegleria gruberi]|eukprot:XP_002675282.1 ras family small GTPase [Naegleria gruberi strain NEG-M]
MPPKKDKNAKEQPEELKIVVFGSGGVGKSALIVQLIQNVFVEQYDPTLEDSYRKDTHIEKKPVILDILDTAGQEEFCTLRDQYIRQGEGFVIVYSVTNRNSFDEVYSFLEQIAQAKEFDNADEYRNLASETAVVLVGNKADLKNERVVSADEGREVAKKFGNITFFETSAKTRTNVEESFMDCAVQIMNKVKKRKKGACTMM